MSASSGFRILTLHNGLLISELNLYSVSRNPRTDKKMKRFENSVVLVTGSARGQGREHVLGFAREGATVVVNDICDTDPVVPYELSKKKQLESTVEDVKKIGAKCLGICADVSSSKQVQEMVKEVVDSFGKIDILVNNAGIVGRFSNIVDLSEELWDRAMQVNLKGTFLVTKYTLPSMIAHHHGRIVNISSIGGVVGLAGIFVLRRDKARNNRIHKDAGTGSCTTRNHGQRRLPRTRRHSDARFP